MNCKACRIEIEELDGSHTLSRGAGAHLESCAGCRAFQAEQAALGRLIGTLEPVAAPPDFDFRLRARLAAERSVGARQGVWHRFAPGAWSLALAASFVMLIAVGLIVRQSWLSPTASKQQQEVASYNPGNNNSGNSAYPSPAPSVSPLVDFGNVKNSIDVMTPKQTPSQRRGTVEKGRDEESRDNTNASSGNQEIVSNESAVTGATNRLPPGIPDPVTQPNAMIAVPLQTSMKPATVTLNYGGAKPQMLSLRPVTFGAQDVFERSDVQRTFITSEQGVW